MHTERWLAETGEDANNLVKSGYYRAGNYGNIANVPSAVAYSGHWGVIAVFSADKTKGVIQCLSDFGSNQRTLYLRMLIGFGQGWSHWFSVPMTDAGA